MRKFCIFIIAGIILASAAFAGSDPLIFSYVGGTGAGNSTSKFSENRWDYRYQYHVLMLSGDVPQGKMFSQIQLEERDYMTGLGYARLSLWGNNYSIDLGDNTVNFSDLTLSSLGYQGAGISMRPSKNFSLSIVGGNRGSGVWGYDVRRDSRPKENFSGVRLVYSSDSGYSLNSTYVSMPGGQDVFAYGADYSIWDLTLGAEYGSAVDGKALRGELKYSNNWLTLGTIYRDVDSTYLIPIDYINYKGMKGTFSSFSFTPFGNFTVSAQSNSYLDRLNTSGEALVIDSRGDISYNLTPSTNVGYCGWRNDRTAYDRGGISEGEIMYITQYFQLLTKNAIYYRYQPTWFTSDSTSEESYMEKKDVAGINISICDTLRLNYEVENATRFLKNTDITVQPSAYTIRADLFETQLFGGPFYLASSANYRRDLPDKDMTSMESTSCYTDMTLRYKPGPDFSCYITGKVLDAKAPDAERATRQQNDFGFGVTYSFNTYIYLK